MTYLSDLAFPFFMSLQEMALVGLSVFGVAVALAMLWVYLKMKKK